MGLENIVFGVLLVVTVFLFSIALVALIRGKTIRMFFVAGAFFAFLIKAVLLVMYLFAEFWDPAPVFVGIAMADTVALLLLYAGVLKR